MAETIDYKNLLLKYPWIVKKNQKAIVSPDTDGLLCGLFMSHFLNWGIAGFYDGKVLLLKKGLSAKDCIFLDMEIFRKGIKSVGQHMVMYNMNDLPKNWGNFVDCIQPNNIRKYDYRSVFNLKYPLATIHILIAILSNEMTIDIGKNAICPLLYVDGTFKNLFNYPANCLSWLHFLGGDVRQNPLYSIFYNDHYSLTELMMELKDLFVKLGTINNSKQGGDKIKISDSKGNIKSFELKKGSYSLSNSDKSKAEKLITLLSGSTEWDYKSDLWCFDEMGAFIFSKASIKPGKKNYADVMAKSPLSFAITSTLSLEYTIEKPDILP